MQQSPNKNGFTIVELLIVVVVIAILAAISLVAYTGIQNRAHASVAQSDLNGAKKQLLLAQVDTGTYPTATSSLIASDGTTYELSVNNASDPKTFCLTATNGNISYKVTEATAPSEGSCPGHSSNGVEAITNLASNPSLEAGSSLWSPRWFGAGGATGTTTRVTAAALFGSYGYRKIWTVGGGGQDIGFGYTQPVTAGKTYTFSVYTRCSVTTAHRRWLYWRDASNNQVGATGLGTETVIPANTWQRLSLTDTAPAGAVSALFAWGPYPSSGVPASSAGETLDTDGMMVTEGATLYTYADGDSSNWIWNGAQSSSTSTGPAL